MVDRFTAVLTVFASEAKQSLESHAHSEIASSLRFSRRSGYLLKGVRTFR